MSDRSFSYRFRPPLAAPQERGGRPPAYSRTVEDGMLVERDVAVGMRDGTLILVDVFRPTGEEPAAPLIAWGPYGKHGHTRMSVSFPGSGVEDKGLSHHTIFEAPDPTFWVPRGYAVINVDPRGTWYSQGRATYLSVEEARDYYDLIEWAGTRDWSNGRVGLTGVSYLTQSQWQVAALSPPHLAAINPWEGWSDIYREVVRHGGIPETRFWGSGYIAGRWGHSTTEVEDLMLETRERPFFDDYWRSKIAPLADIKVPAYVVASWSDQGLHTRGTLEAFKAISSPQKWLEVHGRKKWAHYYEKESLARQATFFDKFLHGRESEVDSWPPVRLELRERYGVGLHLEESEWPLARTRHAPLHLDAATGSLRPEPPETEAVASYSADGATGAPDGATFEITFAGTTDLVGHMSLKLWLKSETANDADIFVVVQKLDAAGEPVPFAFYGVFEDGPAALGWLRASHRELDEGRSTPWQPVLLHRRELPLVPGEPTPMHIEIWPSATRFHAGEKLRLTIRGRDMFRYEHAPVQALHEDSVNCGVYGICTGGRYDSRLLVPVADTSPSDEAADV